MCEANVYINSGTGEELLMEKVDRIIPGEDDTIFMESIFGERKVVKARIKEMELVHHRVVLDPLQEKCEQEHLEIWLEPATDHGHFHEGEEVKLQLLKGYNMHPAGSGFENLKAYVAGEGSNREVEIHDHHGHKEIVLEQETDGLILVYAEETGERTCYASILVEVGHHHHHSLNPAGLPLEIFPSDYSHARMGENYEIQVLRNGEKLAGAKVLATYSSTRGKDYPHHLVTDQEGRARLFITARGNYLFSVSDGGMTSTFTLVKSF